MFCISCGTRTGISEDTIADTIEEEPLRMVDSLAASSLRLVDFWTCNDSVVVELNNPYEDVIVLDDEYYIYEVDSDSLLLKDTHKKIIIDPQNSCSFNISIGLDSIWYYKDKTYRFIFPGKRNDIDVIYHYSNLKLGYMNRHNGLEVGIPDTII
ncbi:MAG: hypothetical protein K2L98_02080, partial [Bacilli bacterium]|nr:hypothetical protein [Bacilli bacterium]